VVSRGESACAGELLVVGHGTHAARAVLRPRFASGRLRLHPRSLPVLSDWRDEACSALAAYSGEPRRPSSPPSNPSRPTAQDQPYPFAGLFLKKTPSSCVIQTAVLGQMKIPILIIYLNSKIVSSIYRIATTLFCS
jgi:hypothetical protein